MVLRQQLKKEKNKIIKVSPFRSIINLNVNILNFLIKKQIQRTLKLYVYYLKMDYFRFQDIQRVANKKTEIIIHATNNQRNLWQQTNYQRNYVQSVWRQRKTLQNGKIVTTQRIYNDYKHIFTKHHSFRIYEANIGKIEWEYNSTVIVGVFNTILSIKDRATREKNQRK